MNHSDQGRDLSNKEVTKNTKKATIDDIHPRPCLPLVQILTPQRSTKSTALTSNFIHIIILQVGKQKGQKKVTIDKKKNFEQLFPQGPKGRLRTKAKKAKVTVLKMMSDAQFHVARLVTNTE